MSETAERSRYCKATTLKGSKEWTKRFWLRLAPLAMPLSLAAGTGEESDQPVGLSIIGSRKDDGFSIENAHIREGHIPGIPGRDRVLPAAGFSWLELGGNGRGCYTGTPSNGTTAELSDKNITGAVTARTDWYNLAEGYAGKSVLGLIATIGLSILVTFQCRSASNNRPVELESVITWRRPRAIAIEPTGPACPNVSASFRPSIP